MLFLSEIVLTKIPNLGLKMSHSDGHLEAGKVELLSIRNLQCQCQSHIYIAPIIEGGI